MMMRAKKTGLCTSCAASRDDFHERFASVAERLVWRRMFSTITTEPSTTMPKSSAPSDSRFAGNVLQVQQNRGEQEREGNGDGDDERAAHIAQEQKENQRDQQHSVGQISQHGVRGVVHQIAAVEMRNELHCRGRQLAIGSVQFVDLLVQRIQRGSASAPLRSRTMPSTTSSSLMTVPSSWRMVLPSCPSRTFGACTTVPRSRTRTGVPFCDFDHGGRDVVGGLHQADGAHVQRLLTTLNESAAGIGIVVGQRLFHLA